MATPTLPDWVEDNDYPSLLEAQGRSDELRASGALTRIVAVLEYPSARWRVDVWVDAEGRALRPERVVHPDDAPRLPYTASPSSAVH